MMPGKTLLHVPMVAFLVPWVAWGQITLTQSHFETLFGAGQQNYLYTDTSGLSTANVGTTGGPRVYDFTGRLFAPVDTTQCSPASGFPQFVPRFPGDALAFRLVQDRQTNSSVYFLVRFTSNGLFSPGESILSVQFERYKHHVPQELLFPYPLTHGYSTSYSVTTFDTTYLGGVPGLISSHSVNVTKAADGWGTLVLPGFGPFNCLRFKQVDLPPAQKKSFFYLTQQGVLLEVASFNNQPDTGIVGVDEMNLFVPAGVVAVRSGSPLPDRFALEQNYPNPFNPKTKIEFRVGSLEFVELSIYDVLGRKVATLVNERKEPGSYQVEFDASHLASGVYLYKLEAGSFVETRKMILMK